MYKHGSPFFIPSIKNCIAKIVFPLPLPPATKLTESYSNPPSINLSNFLIPVGTLLFVSSFLILTLDFWRSFLAGDFIDLLEIFSVFFFRVFFLTIFFFFTGFLFTTFFLTTFFPFFLVFFFGILFNLFLI